MATTTSTITSKSIVSIPPTPSSYDKTVVETAIASIIATQSVRNEKTIDAIEKTESFPPAEILALVDYNRIYDISAAGEIKKNSYGSYYETLESVHSITNEDVAYIVQKCLENDVAGQWAALKNIADSDVIDSNNLINLLI